VQSLDGNGQGRISRVERLAALRRARVTITSITFKGTRAGNGMLWVQHGTGPCRRSAHALAARAASRAIATDRRIHGQRGGHLMIDDQDLLRLAPDSIVLLDGGGRVISWNPASEDLYGWTGDEIAGRDMRECLACQAVDPRVQPHEVRGAFQGLLDRRTRDGSIRRVHVTRRPFGQAGDRMSGIVEFGRDVSAVADVREQLDRATHRYTNLFNAMPASFWELDFRAVGEQVRRWQAHGVHDLPALFASDPSSIRALIAATRIVDINDKSVALFGRGVRDELLHDLNLFWPDESLPVFAASVLAALKGQPTFTADATFRSIDGRHFETLFTVSMPPETLARGQLLIGIVDVSDTQRALRELEASERRYRDLFDAMPAANMAIDTAALDARVQALRANGIDDLQAYLEQHPAFVRESLHGCRIVSANQRFRDLMGLRGSDGTELPLQRVGVDAPDAYRRLLLAYFAGEQGFEAQLPLRRVDGTVLHAIVSCAFRPIQSRPHIMLCNLVDVTDRVHAEEALARTRADLAHAGRVAMLGELTASIAHEVSQPLASITLDALSSLRWLSRDPPDHDELRALARRSAAQAGRAGDILQRIRQLARRGQPISQPVDVHGVVHEALVFLRDELDRHGASAQLALDAACPVVHGDGIQLQQVVINLAMNAVQAMAHAGSAQRCIRVATRDGEGALVLTVDDTGPGIAAEARSHVFESFFTTKEFGMGIGLPICLSIVTSQGGTIRLADPPPGWSTRFEVALPGGGTRAAAGSTSSP
jgi:two-component system, LuxR family, sensor kinase FixL